MQRSYDQMIHDVALQNLHVVICLDRAGLVGEDGPTHHGVFDLAYLNAVPGLTIAVPMDGHELRNMMYSAQLPDKGPFVIRYPRGGCACNDWQKAFEEIRIGKGRQLLTGKEIAILTLGHPGNFAVEAINLLKTEGIEPALFDMRFLKPIDKDLLHDVFKNFKKVITIEDGTLKGGFASTVLEFMNANNYKSKVISLGVPDEFIPHGKLQELYKYCGFDAEGIIKAVKELRGIAVVQD